MNVRRRLAPEEKMKIVLERYHTLSISESVNSIIKTEIPTKTRKKLPKRKKTEENIKIKHAQPEAVQLSEAYKSGYHKGLQGAGGKLILFHSPYYGNSNI